MADFSILPIDYPEALEALEARLPLSADVFAELSDEARVRAFSIAEAATEAVAEAALELIVQATVKGTTLADFAAGLAAEFERAGLKGPAPWRVENIFVTNVLTALAVGRYRQLTDPAVIASRPFWEYDAIGDSSTRPAHAAQDGTIRAFDDPYWDTWYPPNGFRCRCGVNSLSPEQAAAKGGPTPEVRVGQTPPDAGFGHNPGQASWGRPVLDQLAAEEPPRRWEDLFETPEQPPLRARPWIETADKTLPTPELLDRALASLGLSEQKSRLSDPRAGVPPLVLDRRFVEHFAEKDPRRLRFAAAAAATIDDPQEVWLSAQKDAVSGKVRLAYHHLARYGKGRGMGLVVISERRKGYLAGLTFVPADKPHNYRKFRTGVKVYGGDN